MLSACSLSQKIRLKRLRTKGTLKEGFSKPPLPDLKLFSYNSIWQIQLPEIQHHAACFSSQAAEGDLVDFEVVLTFNRKTGFSPYRKKYVDHIIYERESFWYIQHYFGTTYGS